MSPRAVLLAGLAGLAYELLTDAVAGSDQPGEPSAVERRPAYESARAALAAMPCDVPRLSADEHGIRVDERGIGTDCIRELAVQRLSLAAALGDFGGVPLLSAACAVALADTWLSAVASASAADPEHMGECRDADTGTCAPDGVLALGTWGLLGSDRTDLGRAADAVRSSRSSAQAVVDGGAGDAAPWIGCRHLLASLSTLALRMDSAGISAPSAAEEYIGMTSVLAAAATGLAGAPALAAHLSRRVGDVAATAVETTARVAVSAGTAVAAGVLASRIVPLALVVGGTYYLASRAAT